MNGYLAHPGPEYEALNADERRALEQLRDSNSGNIKPTESTRQRIFSRLRRIFG